MIALLCMLIAVSAHADEDPVLDGITAEVERAKQLRLPDGAPPHHILVRAQDGWELRSRAVFGELVWSVVRPQDVLKVEVRAGTPGFDSTGLGERWGRAHGIDTSGLPDAPTVRAVRERVWKDLDEQYKLAVENLGTKTGAKEAFETEDAAEASWQVIDEPLDSVTREPAPRPELESAEALVKGLSGELRASGLEHVEVELSERVSHRVIVGSDGTRVVVPYRWVWLGMEVRVRAPDDEAWTFKDFVVARTREELPSREVLSRRLKALEARAQQWAGAERVEEPWYGPVVVEGRTAAKYVDRLLGNQLTGTPPMAIWTPWRQEVDPVTPSAARPGTRLLPLGWTVTDDPGRLPEARCCRTIDDEGVPSREVSLVEDGTVVGHLMTRTPNRWFTESTGHARPSDSKQREIAKVSHLVVAPRRSVSRAKLYKAAAKEARRQGLDRFLILRDRGDVVWRLRDGREIPVRGLDLPEIDTRALRAVVYAGPVRTTLVDDGKTAITAPDFLLGNQAVLPRTIDPEPPLRRKSPLASD